MQRIILIAIAGAALNALASGPSHGQSIAQKLARADGAVEVIYPSRSTVCGDGRGMIGHIFGRSMTYNSGAIYNGRSTWSGGPCETGPARAEVSVASGQIVRLRPFVGPIPSAFANTQTLNVSAAEASAWLSDLVATGNGRVADDAMLPLLLADGTPPWPLLLRVARDENRSRSTRSSAMNWLGAGISEKLGLVEDETARSDEDQMREEAVFVLSQGRKGENVPDLIDLAKNGKYPSIRRSAIFWLGQTGDPRATDTYAQLLNIR
jgi:hypothetical protein